MTNFKNITIAIVLLSTAIFSQIAIQTDLERLVEKNNYESVITAQISAERMVNSYDYMIDHNYDSTSEDVECVSTDTDTLIHQGIVNQDLGEWTITKKAPTQKKENLIEKFKKIKKNISWGKGRKLFVFIFNNLENEKKEEYLKHVKSYPTNNDGKIVKNQIKESKKYASDALGFKG